MSCLASRVEVSFLCTLTCTLISYVYFLNFGLTFSRPKFKRFQRSCFLFSHVSQTPHLSHVRVKDGELLGPLVDVHRTGSRCVCVYWSVFFGSRGDVMLNWPSASSYENLEVQSSWRQHCWHAVMFGVSNPSRPRFSCLVGIHRFCFLLVHNRFLSGRPFWSVFLTPILLFIFTLWAFVS